MELELTERSQELLELLITIPPQLDIAKKYLETNQLTADEVTRVANIYADKCFRDYDEYLYDNWPEDCTLRDLPLPEGIAQGILSAHLCEVIEFLLRYGLDPNAVYIVDGDVYNIMRLISFIDNEYIAADAMVLLLEAGGDPNLVVEFETIYECVSDDVWFGALEQELRWRYDNWIHVWMVMLAYGGTPRGKKSPLEVFREYYSNDLFEIKKLKNHRDYYYGISMENHEPVIHIYDKRTLWEVARA